MPLLDVLTGWKSLPLLGDAMDETRAAHVSYGSESIHQHVDVVPVDRTEVAEAKLLEQDPGREERLHALFPFPDQRPYSGERAGGSVHNRPDGGAQSVVKGIPLN